MHLTIGGSVQRPLTRWPRGWPVGPTLQPLVGWLHVHALQEVVTRNLKLKVGGSRTRWPPGHVARSAGLHLVRYRLNQDNNSSLGPYKYLPAGGIQDTTFYL
jgi:hypothetical protein